MKNKLVVVLLAIVAIAMSSCYSSRKTGCPNESAKQLQVQRLLEFITISSTMHWIHLTDEAQLQKIVIKSQEKPQVIFTYTHCNISDAILSSLQQKCCPERLDFHFLDLSAHEDISAKVAGMFRVAPHGPQILVINDGACIFETSGAQTSLEEILLHLPVAV